MNLDPRQNDPQYQSPLEGDSQRAAQFGMGSQADAAAQGTTSATGGARIVPGTDVFGSDGKKVGTVQEVYNDSFLVQKGIFFVHDYFIPMRYATSIGTDRIELSITSDEAKNQDWSQRPGISMAGEAQPMESQQYGADYGVYGRQGPDDTIQSAAERGETEGNVNPPLMGSGGMDQPGGARPASNDQATMRGAQYGAMGTPASEERNATWVQSPGSSGVAGTTPSDWAPEYGNMGHAGPAGSPGIPPVTPGPDAGARGTPSQGAPVEEEGYRDSEMADDAWNQEDVTRPDLASDQGLGER